MAAGEHHILTTQAHSTAHLHPRLQFDCFCDAIASTYAGIQPERLTRHGFDAEFRSVSLSQLHLARLDAPAHRASRGSREKVLQPDDSLFLNLSPYLDYHADVAGRPCTARAGQPLLLDNSQTFHLFFDPAPRMRLYSLRLTPEQLGVTVTPALTHTLNQAFVSDPLGRLASQQWRLLVEAAEMEQWRAVNQMSELVLPLLRQLAQQHQDAEAVGAMDIRYIKTVASLYLADPDFNLLQLATHFGCSRRTIQARFAEAGERFSSWLMNERLERVRQQLSDPAQRQVSTEQLAFAQGFSDASHFRHRFKARYGLAPQAYRRRQLDQY
ncbi:hypothetical protein BGP77_05805 [Saccharospirillum sp. MSK14-1]|uniref:AraC family transcriptional regulator n=1 Tax=Saccharospirillum sp. MSK14-1 TaxID=1897632 RepID=UPI000D3570EE|nr:AraC family transcriptional regulator [Saccharospirillum sp. MSK14-1]PTY36799.1 hypothetical protein BGP77_05805 [Saccharospirillum sp. MSK14-1]